VTSKLPKGDPLEEAKEEKTKEIGDK